MTADPMTFEQRVEWRMLVSGMTREEAEFHVAAYETPQKCLNPVDGTEDKQRR